MQSMPYTGCCLGHKDSSWSEEGYAITGKTEPSKAQSSRGSAAAMTSLNRRGKGRDGTQESAERNGRKGLRNRGEEGPPLSLLLNREVYRPCSLLLPPILLCVFVSHGLPMAQSERTRESTCCSHRGQTSGCRGRSQRLENEKDT